MFKSILIGGAAFLIIAGTAYAYSPESLPLVEGQVYRTGSPLSRPGIGGLFGSIADSFTMGAFGNSTGIRTNGGGAVMLVDGHLVEVDPSMADNQGCYGIEINGECHKTLTQDEAQSILDETAVADNADYATNTERVCNLSKAELMKQSISLYDQGITASDCAGNPVEFAGTGCDGQMTVAYVEDEKLGVRGIYVCGGK